MQKYNEILKKRYSSWDELEKNIEALPTTKLKGDVFEEFIFVYLNLKNQLYQIKEVFRAGDIPRKLLAKYQIEKRDSGIDGLIVFNDNKVAGYQVKFRTNRARPSYDELAKFWVEAQHTDFNYTIANCYSITDLSKKQSKHLQILVDEFSSLDQIFFDELYDFVQKAGKITRKKHKPFDFQIEMIKNVNDGFKKHSKGKLIAACGTGKTLTSLWITESLESNSILFLAPSLALIKQTLESWADQSKYPFSYLCVCSDKTVSDGINDEGDISIKDFNIPVTTNSDEVSHFLKNKFKNKKIVFSTYQSLSVLKEGVVKAKYENFDIIIFDEAHRTAGAKDASTFSLALNDKDIPAKKRLFMTATERLIQPALKRKAKEFDQIIFSMDDEEVYGPVFHRFNFGEAINMGVISDYKIILAGIQENDLYNWIKNDKTITIDVNKEDYQTSLFTIFSQVLISKAIKEYPIKKVISFHSSIKNAKIFTSGLQNTPKLSDVISKINDNIDKEKLLISHINSTISTGDRKEILDEFKDSEFGVISNSRCLTEGVDVPVIDSIYFVEPKNSLIDIIQACGRALRKPTGLTKENAYFIIPVLIPDGIDNESIFNLPSFETLFNVIQSLRDQDSRLEEWIDELNKQAIKGKQGKYSKTNWNPINISIPKQINLEQFEKKLYLKIAEVNANPTILKGSAMKIYGKKERRSDYKRVFKTLGDYGYKTYEKNLVMPTISKFKTKDDLLSIEDLKVNHNNVSHTVRLGLITKTDKLFQLSPLGLQLFEKNINFDEIFKRQMLRYSETIQDKGINRTLFPYRTCLKILLEVKSINFLEFAFCIYSLYDSSDENLIQAIEDIYYLRNNFPNINLVNNANKKHILKDLNNRFGTTFKETDIWSKKTTINNQFIYFKDHLSVFTEFLEVTKNGIKIKNGQEYIGYHILAEDNQLEFEKDELKRLQKYLSTIVAFIIFRLIS